MLLKKRRFKYHVVIVIIGLLILGSAPLGLILSINNEINSVKIMTKQTPVVIASPSTQVTAPQLAVTSVQTPATTVAPLKHDFTIPAITNSLPPVITNFKTTDPVVFLGIDDGAYKDPSVVKMMKDNNIKASLFLAKSFIGNNPGFFKDLIASGSLVEDHTLSHDLKMVKDMTYDQQKAEICGMADYEQAQYGRRPIFVRPPGGAYSSTFVQAAGACGMRAVVNWIAKANGGSMQYQVGHVLRPGDIVLMHFRPEFKKDMQAFIDAENAAGLHTELLENWI